MSDTQPIGLNSASLGIGRHVSGIADPFNGHIDEFRISHLQRSDGWIETTWNNMSDRCVRRGRGRGAGRRRVATASRRWCGRLPDGVTAAFGADRVMLLDRTAANVAVAQDPATDLKAAKNKSTERINDIVATIMATGRAKVAQEEPQPEYFLFFV